MSLKVHNIGFGTKKLNLFFFPCNSSATQALGRRRNSNLVSKQGFKIVDCIPKQCNDFLTVRQNNYYTVKAA